MTWWKLSPLYFLLTSDDVFAEWGLYSSMVLSTPIILPYQVQIQSRPSCSIYSNIVQLSKFISKFLLKMCKMDLYQHLDRIMARPGLLG